jgi:glycosyltransferase involved in cell wall biosynthesis
VVPPGDRSALAAAINRLINDRRERERMGTAGRRLIAARHSLEALAGKMGPIYASTWSDRRASASTL